MFLFRRFTNCIAVTSEIMVCVINGHVLTYHQELPLNTMTGNVSIYRMNNLGANVVSGFKFAQVMDFI